MTSTDSVQNAPTPSTIRDWIGKPVGTSDWLLIDQARIDAFGVVTDDPDPMHIDPEWSRLHSPYRVPIAFGFLTLSMLTRLSHDIISRSAYSHANGGEGYQINYGIERLRFVAPVYVGKRIRAHMDLLAVEERAKDEIHSRFKTLVEIENEERPALVCEWLTLWVREEGHARIIAKESVAGRD